MFNKLVSIGRSQLYWFLLLVLSLLLEGVALYFQHILNEWPCVLCIQVRLLLLALITLSVIALLAWRFIRLHAPMHFIAGCISAAMLDRSWNLLATERGWIEGECSVDLGMPAWFPIDKWLPDIFAAWTSCGYTPVIMYGITMAEMLLVLSICLLLLCVALTAATIRKNY